MFFNNFDIQIATIIITLTFFSNSDALGDHFPTQKCKTIIIVDPNHPPGTLMIILRSWNSHNYHLETVGKLQFEPTIPHTPGVRITVVFTNSLETLHKHHWQVSAGDRLGTVRAPLPADVS